MAKNTREVGRFGAIDSNGAHHAIVAFQDFLDVSNVDTGEEEIAGIKSYRTIKGERVQWVSKGVYDLPTPVGMIRLTSADPKAT